MAISNPTMAEGYKYAVLATASYVRMGGLVLNGATFAQQAARPDLSGGRIPIAQGSYFFDPANAYGVPVWNILSYYGSDSPASQDAIAAQDKSGFGATLFEKGGEKVLAMRGTEPFEDGAVDLLSADLGQIGILGLALTQVVSMANYVMRLRAPFGANVPQLTVSASAQLPLESERYVRAKGDASAGVADVYFVFNDTTSALGLGKIAAGDVVKVTGHSLGGHLAFMAARLFPDVFDRNVTVVNSAGYDPTKANQVNGLFEIISGLLLNVGPLGIAQIFKAKIADEVGAAAIFLATYANNLTEVSINKIRAGLFGEAPFVQGIPIVTSIRSEDLAPGDDKNIVASDTTGAEKYGASIEIPTEANNHIVEPLMDALALQALIEPLQGGAINSGSVVRLLEASSNQSTRSYEGLTEALYRLFFKDEKFLNELGVWDASRLPTSDESSFFGTGKGTIGARNAFYDAVLRTQQAIAGAPKPLTLVSLADMPLAELTMRAQANNGLAYRYALQQLNPFAILGPDALYATHNAAGALNYNGASSTALTGMTPNYITDRAQFLAWKMQVNTVDAANVAFSNDAHAWSFEDRAQNYSILIERLGATTSLQLPQVGRVIFGADASEQSLLGSAEVDHLYGGSGDDSLEGRAGTDYLEGNAGNDTLIGGLGDDELQGGSGFDTYIYVDGDGFDTIIDSDGVGRIQYNGRYLTGGSRVFDDLYEDSFGVQYRFLEYAEGIGAVLIGDAIYIENYSEGDLGLSLEGVSSTPSKPTTVTAYVYESSELPIGFNSGDVSDLLGALYGSEKDDQFLGSSQVAAVLGRSGNDIAILDASAYGIVVDMGAGDDFLDASRSAGSVQSGLLAGGAGNDYIQGGSGNDIIWGDNYRAANQVGAGADAIRIDGFIYSAGAPFYGVFPAQFDYLSEIAGIPNPNLGELALEETIFSGALDGAIAYVTGIDSGFDDFVDAGSGDDFVVGGSGSDHILGGDGNDRIWGDYGGGPEDAPTYQRLADSFGALVLLFGRPGDDLVDGGSGDDLIVDADGGNDVLSGGEGNDTIYSAEAFWTSALEVGAHNLISGGSGNDVIEVQNDTGGFDVVEGGDGDDQIQVYARRFEFDSDDDGEIDIFGPTGGRAFVFGGSGNDVLNVSADDALVDGGSGDDEYLVTGRSITISDPSGEDTVRLPGLFDHSTFDAFVESLLTEDESAFPDQRLSVFVTQDGGDLVATLSSMVDELPVDYSQIRFRGWFDGISNRIEHIVVSDGFGGESVLTPEQLSAWGGVHIGGGGTDELLDSTDYTDLSFGRGGDDLIATGAGNDRIYGGTGNDELYGGAGDDIYYYAAGDGEDLVYDISGFDEVRVGPGLTAADVGAALGEAGIVLTIGVGKIGVVGGTRFDPGIEQFRFADGSTVLVTSLLPAETIVVDDTPADDTPVVIVGGSEDGGGTAGPVDTSGEGDIETLASPRVSVSPPDSVIPLQDASYDFAGTLQHGDPYLNAGDMLVASPGSPEAETPVFGSRIPDIPTPLDMQSMLDAMEEFDAATASPTARQMLPARETSQSDPVVRSDSTLTSLALTNALLMFHLEQSDARGVPDGAAEWFQQTDALAGIGVASGLSSFGPTSFGRQAPGLATFAGLQEGFTRLA